MIMFSLQEPLKGYGIKVGIVPIEQIRIPSIQRELSDNLVRKLMTSIEKVGFVDPILLIEGEEGFEVINGQHRLEAAKLLGMKEVLAIVLPPQIKEFVISLNVEKAPNLRDKAHQAYEIFMDYLRRDPSLEEIAIADRVEEACYLTVGFVIERFGERKFPGYAFEKVLRKIDGFLRQPLRQAEAERERRAELLLEVKEVLNRRYEELGLSSPLQKEAIVTRAFFNVYGKRVRELSDDFLSVLRKLKEEIPQVELGETV